MTECERYAPYLKYVAIFLVAAILYLISLLRLLLNHILR